MIHSIASNKVEFDHKSFASTGCDLNEFSSLSIEFLSSSSSQLGGAVGHTLTQQVGAGDNVAEEHGLQSFLVFEKFVEGINWNLVKSRVSWGKDSEWTLSIEGGHEVSSLQGCMEGGEVRVLCDKGRNGLSCRD